LGAWWSYAVLGWGGYFAWDPVENASLLPFLTATALIHSVMVQEKRDMLKLWNLTLVVATFLLTILATFLTRSGVLSSVHAFAGGVGPSLLVFIGVVLAAAVGLLVWRGNALRSDGVLDAPVCRESGFLLNNLLLVGLTLTVLVGTLFPIFAEAIDGSRLSVGEPYFNATAVPIAIALLFLMGVGPALPWRRASRSVLRRRLLVPSLAVAPVPAALVALGASEPEVLAAVTLGGFVVAQAAWDLGRIARRRAIGAMHRRVGGQVVHVGVAVIAIGIAVSSAYSSEAQVTLRPGEALSVAGRSVRFDGLSVREEPRRRVQTASLTLEGGASLRPALNFYRSDPRREATASPAIRPGLDRDVYAVLVKGAKDGSAASLRVLVRPLVTWLWIGGAIILVGAAVAVFPRRTRVPVT
ncbi:MAG: cytochrome c-type biogenesis CcmF C-terminal domain-containing protein, partial [Gaiellaceae bacterium]